MYASNPSYPQQVDARKLQLFRSLQSVRKLSMTHSGGANINRHMEMRKLGSSDLQVSPIMLGGNVFGWTADESTSFRILDAFVDHGFNFIDTADVYTAWVPGHSGGESETVIGKWLAKSGKRDKVILATKVGMEVRGQK